MEETQAALANQAVDPRTSASSQFAPILQMPPYCWELGSTRMPRIAKSHYIIALGCYLTIPAVMLAGVGLSRLIDPELARFSADYARNFRLLELAATGALMATTGLAMALWGASYYLVLKSRQRSMLWLALAAAGPFGFMFITMLADRSPAPQDLYQQFLRKLKLYWRIPLEIVLFVSAWILAYQCVVLKRESLIRFESFWTGTPVETIIDRQTASSGMYAFGEGLETIFVVTLLYLLLPMIFNLVGQRFKR
jgi:hypothetical protein